MDAALDRAAGQGDSVCGGFGAMGMAVAVAAGDSDAVELALVAGVALAAMVGVWLPGRFFAGQPHGTVSAQVWRVGLKLTVAYVLAVGSWVLVLGWLAVLFGRQQRPPAEESLVAVPVSAGPLEDERSAAAELTRPDKADGT